MTVKELNEYLGRTGLSPSDQIKLYVKTNTGLKLVELIQTNSDYLDQGDLGDLTNINLPCVIIEHEQ